MGYKWGYTDYMYFKEQLIMGFYRYKREKLLTHAGVVLTSEMDASST